MLTPAKYKRSLVVLLLSLLTLAGSAIDATINFKRITINDGLSLSSVYCIFQDSKGYMWFATEDGLNKYNGQEFKIYNHNPSDPNSLSYRWIEQIVEDPYGSLWLGSRQGLNRLDPATDKLIRYREDASDGKSIQNDTITTLAIFGEDLYIGTSNGLNRIDTKTLKSVPIQIPTNGPLQVNRIYQASNGHICVGTNLGLFLYAPEDGTVHQMLNILEDPSISINAIREYQKQLYLGTDQGILALSTTKGSSTPDSLSFSASTGEPVETLFPTSYGKFLAVTSNGLFSITENGVKRLLALEGNTPSLSIRPQKPIMEDNNGAIWVGTFGDGVYRIDREEGVAHFQNQPADEQSLSDNTVNCILQDRSGSLWIGTYGAGISVYHPQSNLITTLKNNPLKQNSLSSNFVWSVCEVSDSIIWIGTNNRGLEIYNIRRDQYRHLPSGNGTGDLPEGSIRKIYQTQNKEIWVAVDPGGLNRYDAANDRFETFFHDPSDPHSISSNGVRTIFEDTTGILWIGTTRGLNSFNPTTKKFTRYLNDPEDETSLSHNFIYSAIYMDRMGNLWVGTYGGGLNKLDTETRKFTRYQFNSEDPNSISDNIVFSIYEDEKGYFWIGTNSGLNLFNPSTEIFKRYGTESGLPNDVIYGIMPDDQNHLWLTTNRGISRLDLTQFRFKNLDVTDGLQSNEFNGGSYHRGESGRIYAGGVYGLNIIDPKKIKNRENNSEMIISRLEVLGKEVKVWSDYISPGLEISETSLVEDLGSFYMLRNVAYMDEIKLDYRQRYFSLEFAALNHPLPEKLSYRYRLKNLDDQWNIAGSRNYVTYANLKPGTYLFEAESVNADGSVSPNRAQLRVNITPPFWRSYWFILLEVLLIVVIIVFIYRYLLNQRTNQLLTQQNQQITEANTQLQISENNLKALNATKDKFFSIISHDLKNPFASVLSISELLAGNYEHAEADEIKHGVSKIHETNKHIYELLENLLTWSKSQRGNITMNPSGFNLSTVIETNINILRLAAEKKEITIYFNQNGELKAYGDRDMISTVFRNLLNNAVKFTPSGREISIKIDRDKSEIRISIEDQGVGIAPENLKRLFSIDEKIKTAGTEGEKGTGLGLIICKEFVEKNGGEISVTSIPEKGSTFSFTVPRHSDQE